MAYYYNYNYNYNDDSSISSIGAYNNSQKILLVGEGDFSFSSSLADAFGSAHNIVATSLDYPEFLMENYRSFLANRMNLERRGSVVMHGVDATTMARHPCLSYEKFDCIIFNFPWARIRSSDNHPQIWEHQELMSGFFENAKKMIKEDGEIHVTHKSNSYGLSWNLPEIGADEGLYLIEEVEFELSDYPGYHNKYGYGGDRDFHCYPCSTYKFKLKREINYYSDQSDGWYEYM